VSHNLVEHSSATDAMWQKLEGTHVMSDRASEECTETTMYILI